MKALSGLLISLFSLTAAAGTLVGNGGDSIYCHAIKEDAKFPRSGLYVLDYALTFPHRLEGVAAITDLESSLQRIQNLLDRHVPDAGRSFRAFRHSLPDIHTQGYTRGYTLSDIRGETHGDPSRLWQPARRELINIRDEWVGTLPSNCSRESIAKKRFCTFHQTVIRRVRNDGVIYHYDADVVESYLAMPDGLQASALFVHEWLWDYYDSRSGGSWRIRHANAYLHSVAAENESRDDFIRKVFSATGH